MAWAAQESDAPFKEEEKLQILAFAYGYATHAAGDAFAHQLVNEFTEGVFPAAPDVASDERDLANAIRHFLIEDYIKSATPRADNNGARSLVPNGDVSNLSSPRIEFDAPIDFIYEALLKPFSGDPSARADSGVTTLGIDTGANAFTRSERLRCRWLQSWDGCIFRRICGPGQ
jgi:hypothetical protein